MQQRADRKRSGSCGRSIADARHHQLPHGLYQAAGARAQHEQERQGRDADRHQRRGSHHLDHRQRSVRARDRERLEPETNVTFPITGGKGAVRDLDVSPDGTKVVFSLRMPLDPTLANTDPKQPNWNIYQYDATAKTVTQLTNDDITSGHDVGAHYLPDGRIVFASTRQLATQAILLDEGRPQYQAVTTNQQQAIFLLHVMNGDGSNMHQIIVQHQSRLRTFGARERTDRVLALGGDQRPEPDQPVRDQPGRHGPAALLWCEQPRHRRQYRGHQQQRDSVPDARQRADGKLLSHRPAHARHPARRRYRAHRRGQFRGDQPAELARRRPRARPEPRRPRWDKRRRPRSA